MKKGSKFHCDNTNDSFYYSKVQFHRFIEASSNAAQRQIISFSENARKMRERLKIWHNLHRYFSPKASSWTWSVVYLNLRLRSMSLFILFTFQALLKVGKFTHLVNHTRTSALKKQDRGKSWMMNVNNFLNKLEMFPSIFQSIFKLREEKTKFNSEVAGNFSISSLHVHSREHPFEMICLPVPVTQF